MSILILILVQVIFLAVVLRAIFSLIDRVVESYMKPRFSPKRQRTWQEMRGFFRRWRANKFDSKIRKSKSHGLSGLWHQLLIRVQFDIPTAERLVFHLKIKHPGQTDRWYIEKAIFDLERDKGRY
jgi:hypothetical protein